MAINKPTLFGVFAWRADGKYKIKDSIGRLYRRKSAAQKMADALNSDPGACAPLAARVCRNDVRLLLVGGGGIR